MAEAAQINQPSIAIWWSVESYERIFDTLYNQVEEDSFILMPPKILSAVA